MTFAIYCILTMAIFLESALLPAALLPGDSLLLLAGAMITKHLLRFYPTLAVLVTATGTGYWLNYLTGRWLIQTKSVQKWLMNVSAHDYQRAQNFSRRYGPSALLIGRFIGFIRTLLPLLAGATSLRQRHFHFFNWLGAVTWVGVLLQVGEHLANLPVFKENSAIGMAFLLLLPILLFVAGLMGSFWFARRRRKREAGS
ncbi:DedA family protein [Martelella alba]|uniref:Inner membrane protein YghB n=1 Tax=Martelella alba TaxID=2590451 RepID=A0ABY2SSS3_9HYPH|nr:DedA family protein [Martelella alba]